MATKRTKKRDARAKLLFAELNPFTARVFDGGL